MNGNGAMGVGLHESFPSFSPSSFFSLLFIISISILFRDLNPSLTFLFILTSCTTLINYLYRKNPYFRFIFLFFEVYYHCFHSTSGSLRVLMAASD